MTFWVNEIFNSKLKLKQELWPLEVTMWERTGVVIRTEDGISLGNVAGANDHTTELKGILIEKKNTLVFFKLFLQSKDYTHDNY